MTPLRDARGRFLPRIRHDPLCPYVLLQEDGLPAYRTASYQDGYEQARASGGDLVVTFTHGRPLRLVRHIKPAKVVL